MSSDVEFDDIDEEAFQILSQVSETYARPAKRRRVSPDTNTPDDGDDSSESELPSKRNTSPRSKRGKLSFEEDGSMNESREKARENVAKEPKKKKPKHLIHVPKVHRQFKETFQYGTQAADGEPGSSPYMARGARWKLPNPQPRETHTPLMRPLVLKTAPTLETFLRPLDSKEIPSNRTIRNRQPSNSTSTKQDATVPSLDDVDDDDGSPAIASHGNSSSTKTTSSSGKAKSTPGKSFPSRPTTVDLARNLSIDLETFGVPPTDIEDELDILPRTNADSSSMSRLQVGSSARCPSGPSDADLAKELAEIGSDFFSSSPEMCEIVGQRLVAPQPNLKQTTLFGDRFAGAQVPASQANIVRQYRQDIPPEPPTHHKIDLEAMKTWVYPTNLGQTRDYQYSIVKTGLFSNTLVALPTGLGKTFIAATIMLNYYRWFPEAQLVFMAPTKPLVSQQVDACFHVAGIPRSVTTMLNGEVKRDLREEEWANKRVFFVTPQTLENDIASGLADPKRIVLMVIDEAHKATGKYAYVKCVEKIRAFSKSFRILALTATPGSTVEKVQEVVDSLEIAKVEIRTEASIDIQHFVHRRNIDKVVLQPSKEMNEITSLLSKALQPLVNILCGQKAYHNSDPMSLTPYGLMQSMKEWTTSPASRQAGEGLKHQMRSVGTILTSIAHSIKLLKFHGMSPFYAHLKAFRDGVEEQGQKCSKYKKQIVSSGEFKEMMNHLQSWTAEDDFIGHPKITVLCDTILNHFMDAGEGTNAAESRTKVMVFSEFRDSADVILTELLKHKPMVRPSIFVGQADSGRSAGMKQSKQGEVIKDFKTGKFNVLVATCIGEEGLDIGEVDLIICYDTSASPIRMLQRMGRTGRKRAGRIVLLMMEGKEHDNFAKAKDKYEKMQQLISDGRQFAFRNDLSTRIVPSNIKPEVDKRQVEIPFENTQNPALPVPRAKAGSVAKKKKKAVKKFHMPDGVVRCFQKASKIVEGNVPKVKRARRTQKEVWRDAELAIAEQTPIPELDSVLLTSAEEKQLERTFQNVGGNAWDQAVLSPDLTKYPRHQRKLRPTSRIGHSRSTKDFVSTLQKMHTVSESTITEWNRLHAADPDVAMEASSAQEDAFEDETFDEAFVDNSMAVESDEHDATDEEAAHTQMNIHSSGPHGSIDLGFDTEGEDPDDDQDHDLSDFVVKDGFEEKSLASSPFASSSPHAAADTVHRKPFYESLKFPATQDTDDDLPDIGSLGRKTAKESLPSQASINNAVQGRRRKRAVFDDDSEE